MTLRHLNNTTCWFGFAILYACSSSFAGLLVAPTRVILSDEQRVVTVALRHLGTREGRYRISAIFNRMRPDGSMEEVKDLKTILPEERSALKYIRYSPRLAVLTPNVEQIARIMVVAPKSLPDGEYRMHLLFEPTEDTEADSVSSKGGDKSKGSIGMKLEAKMSVAIPITYKHGKTSFEVQISKLKLVQMPDKTLGFSVEMTSGGNAFARGDFEAFFASQDGKSVRVAQIKGIPSYLDKRSFTTALTIPPDTKFRNGVLRVEFREAEEGSSEGKLLSFIEGKVP